MIVPYDGFVGGTYAFPTPRIGSEQCLNFYPLVHRAEGQRAPFGMSFEPCPGTRSFATVGRGPIRDIFAHDGRCWVVSGGEYYELFITGSSAKLGDVSSTVMPVKIETNGTGGGQNMVMSGGLGYIHTVATGAFVQISDADFPANIISLAFVDSYFIVAAHRTRQFNYSGRFDGLTWSAGDLAQKSQTTDDIRMLEVSVKDVWLMGSKTCEVWANTGDTLVTFAPIQGVLIEHGVAAPRSVRRVGGTIVWLAQDSDGHVQCVMAQGYQPRRVSTDAVEAIWQTYGTPAAAEAWTYGEGGHLFYVLTFPDRGTWVFDLSTGLWHERGYLNPATGAIDPHLAQCHAHAFEKHLVGSRYTGEIYELSRTARYDADTYPIRRVRRAPHVRRLQRPGTINRFEMSVDVGEAATTGQGSDPQIMFRYSVDGGKRYSEELFLSQGVLGDYDKRVGIDRLGQGFDWVMEVATSEPIAHAWGGASLDIEGDE